MTGPSVSAVKRLKTDYQRLLKDPVPYTTAKPLDSNILEWHYVVRGAKDTPYEGNFINFVLFFIVENLQEDIIMANLYFQQITHLDHLVFI